MTALATAPFTIRLRRSLSARRYRTGQWFKRAGRAIRYVFGNWTSDDAQRMRWECQDREGFYPLEAISLRGMIAHMEDEEYSFPPKGVSFLDSAISRTADKWCDEKNYVAYEDAETRALDYARDAGTPFTKLDDEEEDQ